ncbi:MAG: DUF89 family protein [Candidatus Omnitrophica bacterium COP1]|nr:DUF89 family protein [Candidatus Omnitrophica bacterium COP1]
MHQTPLCHPCVHRQVLRVFEVASACPEAAGMTAIERETITRELLEETGHWLALQPVTLSPAEVSWTPIKMVYRRLGIADPYRELKQRSNLEAMELLPEMREWIRKSSSPIETAAHLAVAGNIIDLGIHKDYDIHESIQRILEEGFPINHIEGFMEDLEQRELIGQGAKILYICDNAGEIAFDRLLIETLHEFYPSSHITAAVNGGPVLNDALMEDAIAVGLTEIVPVIDNGNDQLGTILSHCSPEFCEAFENADWIISKGQANFETLDGVTDKVLFLLKAKCEAIAQYLGVELHQGVFKQGTALDSTAQVSLPCPSEL